MLLPEVLLLHFASLVLRIVQPLLLLYDSLVVCLDGLVHHTLYLCPLPRNWILPLSPTWVSDLLNQFFRVDLLLLFLWWLGLLSVGYLRLLIEPPALLVQHVHAVGILDLTL